MKNKYEHRIDVPCNISAVLKDLLENLSTVDSSILFEYSTENYIIKTYTSNSYIYIDSFSNSIVEDLISIEQDSLHISSNPKKSNVISEVTIIKYNLSEEEFFTRSVLENLTITYEQYLDICKLHQKFLR